MNPTSPTFIQITTMENNLMWTMFIIMSLCIASYVSNPTICILRNPTIWVKMCNKEPKKALDVKHN
jgi:hypothetical protein